MIHDCTEAVQSPPTIGAGEFFGCHRLEQCCFPEPDPCSGEVSCVEALALLKADRQNLWLDYQKNGIILSRSRGDRSERARSVDEVKQYQGILDNEIVRLEMQCGDRKPVAACSCCGPCSCQPAWSHPRSISFTGGRW